MKLRNDFTQDTRNLFIDLEYTCSNCGMNGVGLGGISLHHIQGRSSKSPYNASTLCGECHRIADNKSTFGVNDLEKKLLKYTKKYLDRINYNPQVEDFQFLEKNKEVYN